MKIKSFLRIFTFVVTVVMLISALPMNAFAQEVQDDLYIASVKLAQADTAEEARELLENEGYIFLDNNLNEGTGEDGIWLGYTTTTNPDEAIYDMKLMNMHGGYTLTSVEEALKSQETAFEEMAEDLTYLVDEFIEAYNEDTIAAQKAYMALNFFRLEEDETELKEENGLGYRLVNEQISMEQLTEIILLCDSGILDSIIKILTMGIQVRNENWMKKLSELGPYDSEKKYSDDEAELKRRADQLLTVLELYADSYNAMEAVGIVSGEFNEFGELENSDIKYGDEISAETAAAKKVDESRHKLYKIVFDELDKFSYGSGTLKDFICSIPMSGSAKDLYPLVSVLSDGEFAALSYGCFLEVAAGAGATSKDFENYDEVYADITKDTSSVYLYAGVDELLLEEDTIIGFTETANRHMAATGELEFYEKESLSEDIWETGKQVARIVGASCIAVMGLSKLTMGTVMIVSAFSTVAAESIKTGVLAGLMKVCAALSGIPAVAIAVLVVVCVAAIFYLVSVIVEEIRGLIDWAKHPIPEYIYDVKEVSFAQTADNGQIQTEYVKRPVFALYEGVRDIDGEMLDLNSRSNDSEQWICLYISRDKQGSDTRPIKASDLLVKKGNGTTPEGYVPLSRFGEVVAYDLNQWDESDDVNGIYVFYKQDQVVSVESNVTYYIYDVYLQSGESDAHCINRLQAAGYTPININLSPDYLEYDSWGFKTDDTPYTYIGYKVTTNPNSALTDIRVEYSTNKGEIKYGAATYAECGSSCGVTLYATKYACAGTPLLEGGLICVNERSDAPEGYEPVNFFAGGPAVSFNTSPTSGNWVDSETMYYLYFLPKTTFTQGVSYLGGVSMMYTDYFTDDDAIPKETKDEISSYVFSRLEYDYAMFGDTELIDTIVYYQTYNPYRAIYSVKATNESTAPEKFSFESVGYVSWDKIQWWYATFSDGYQAVFAFDGYGWPAERNNFKINGHLYVTGNPNSNNKLDKDNVMKKEQPIQMSEFICIEKNGDTSSIANSKVNFKPVTDVFKDSDAPVALKNVMTDNEYTFYVTSSAKDRPYVSSITAADTMTVYRASGGPETGLKPDEIPENVLLAQLAGKGATNFCNFRVRTPLFDQDEKFEQLSQLYNVHKFGYTRTSTKGQALTDVFIYFNGFSIDDPPKTLYKGSTKYTLLCEVPSNLAGYDEAPAAGIYLYGTTDSDAGKKIIDIEVSGNPFMDGYSTVRTMNGRSIMAEVTDYMEYQYKNHPTGKARDFFEVLKKDNGYWNPYWYIHIKREGDDITIQKPYIEELNAVCATGTPYADIDSLFDNGADGMVVEDLNYGIGRYYIFLGYKRTANPEDAIKEIRAYHKKNPPSILLDPSGRTFNLIGDVDFNDGAFGDYIYLYTTKNFLAGDPISDLWAELSINQLGDKTITDSAGNELSVTTHCVQQWNSDTYSNLNKGTAGKAIYLNYNVTHNPTIGTYEPIDYGEDKVYSRSAITGMTETGKYIGAVYVMDKDTLRQERIAAGVDPDDCKVADIPDGDVINRLKEMGATTVLTTPYLITGDNYVTGNKNEVFIGYSRTDTLSKAIKDIAISAEFLTVEQPPETIEIDKMIYKLVAPAATDVKELPHAINLIGQQDGQDLIMPRFYLYTTTQGSGDPVYDICIDENPLKNNWVTVKGANGTDAYEDIAKQAKVHYDGAKLDDDKLYDNEVVYSPQLYKWMKYIVDMFTLNNEEINPVYIHCKKFEGDSLTASKPYIGEIYIAEDSTKEAALAKLIQYSPDGYIDRDLNERAGGRYVYLAYKRVADVEEAITDIRIRQGSNPPKSARLSLEGATNVKYDLAADVDLNCKAGGKYLYLFATKSTKVGNPILELSVPTSTVSYLKCGLEKVTAKWFENTTLKDGYIDLNKGAGGRYLYLVMNRETTEGHNKGEWLSSYAVQADCGNDGYSTDYHRCKDCGAKVPYTVYFPATGDHVDGDDKNHNCDVCGLKDIEPHTEGPITESQRKEPTCVAPGSYHAVVKCEECGKKIRDTLITLAINKNNHSDGKDSDHNCDLCGAVNIEDHTPGTPKRVGAYNTNNTGEEQGEPDYYMLVTYCTECNAIIEIEEDTTTEDSLLASIFSGGSLVAIFVFLAIGIAFAVIVLIKRNKERDEEANKEINEEINQ